MLFTCAFIATIKRCRAVAEFRPERVEKFEFRPVRGVSSEFDRFSSREWSNCYFWILYSKRDANLVNLVCTRLFLARVILKKKYIFLNLPAKPLSLKEMCTGWNSDGSALSPGWNSDVGFDRTGGPGRNSVSASCSKCLNVFLFLRISVIYVLIVVDR